MTHYKMPIRPKDSNKGTFGKVLNICGSKNYIGAAYLSTLSSLRVGAGFSALCSVVEVNKSVSALLPEAVYISRDEGFKKLNNYTVVLIGCGLGLSTESKKDFKRFLTKLQKETELNRIPLVVDADGLNILANENLLLPKNSIITPHPLEAARLLNLDLEEVLNNLEKAATDLTSKYNCITVLKSHRTIVCNTDLEILVNQHGNSALAKSGTGDVLAGIIAGLLAQKVPAFEAAKLGVYLHSRAGELASEDLTEYSVLASDIPEYLPKAIKELL